MPKHSLDDGGLEPLPKHLLWFRPTSPLNYALPLPLLIHDWVKQTHLPVDALTPLALNARDFELLQASEAWFLTSPTAAHCLAQALSQAPAKPVLPSTLAFVGQASLEAWQAAGGAMPMRVALSTTGESMGLFDALVQHRSVCVLRAQAGREDLPFALRNQGVAVSTVAVYQKTPNLHFGALLNSAVLASSEFEIELCFTSSDQVGRVLSALDAYDTLLQSLVWVSHPRVQTAAIQAGFTKVRVFQM